MLGHLGEGVAPGLEPVPGLAAELEVELRQEVRLPEAGPRPEIEQGRRRRR